VSEGAMLRVADGIPHSIKTAALFAIDLIKPGEAIFLNNGILSHAMAGFITKDLCSTIITNSACILTSLSRRGVSNLVMVGGKFSPEFGACLGSDSLHQIGQTAASWVFVSDCGINAQTGISVTDAADAAVKRAMVNQAGKIAVLMETGQSPKSGPFRIAEASVIDHLIVMGEPPEGVLLDFRRLGTSVHILPAAA